MQKEKTLQMYEIINNTFKDMAFCLGTIAATHKVDDNLIRGLANSIEDIYYKTVDSLESSLGCRVVFDSEEYVRQLHPNPAVDGLLKAIQFKPLLSKK